jgi:prepilin-type N-terminal cleavage/methylation domain-containing protein
MKKFFTFPVKKGLRGFSLAEVLIAIVIITILTIGSIAVYSLQLAKARDTERTNDLARMKLFVDQVVAEYGAPISDSTTARKMPQACKTATDLYGCFTALRLSNVEDLTELVLDPSDGVAIPGSDKTYRYKYGANENAYTICTTMEDQGSRLLNSDTNGAIAEANASNSNDMYCIRYTPPGATQVLAVQEIDEPSS